MLYDRFVINQPPQDARVALTLHHEIWTRTVRTSLAHGDVFKEHHGIGLKLGYLMPEQYGPTWRLLQAIKGTMDPQS